MLEMSLNPLLQGMPCSVLLECCRRARLDYRLDDDSVCAINELCQLDVNVYSMLFSSIY